MNNRQHYIDWLRVLTMGLVFFFHCARFFGGGTWHLNNPEQSIVAYLFIGFLDMWFMPMFFLLSGVGAWYGLKSRSGGQFVWERVKRLLVPLYTVGLFILIPPQFYFEISSNSGFNGSFWKSLPMYFERTLEFNPAWPGDLIPYPWSGHLWFLQFLFLISLITLPVMLYFKTENGKKTIESIAALFNRIGGVYTFVIPLAGIMIAIKQFFGGRYSWAEFFAYALFFLMGYLIPADKRFMSSFVRNRYLGLILGIVAFSLEGYFIMGLKYKFPGFEPFSMRYVLFNVIMSIGTWSWLIFFLGLGAKRLNRQSKTIDYANEAVLPFYIFHQSIILIVGWFIIPLQLSILSKYLIIAAISFLVIMVLYQGLVKPVPALRWAVGMKKN